jgi:hypothetical protein
MDDDAYFFMRLDSETAVMASIARHHDPVREKNFWTVKIGHDVYVQAFDTLDEAKAFAKVTYEINR